MDSRQDASPVTADDLAQALKQTLQWLEHPEVNAINFAGSPVNLANHIRKLLVDYDYQTVKP